MLSPVKLRILALSLATLMAPGALAQNTTFQLDDQGNWIAKPSRPLSADEEFIARARAHLADNKPGLARSALTTWIDDNIATDSPFLPQAYLLRGDAVTLAGNEYKALYDYEAVIKGFPESEEFHRALERELEIAVKYVNGLKRIWLGVRWSDATEVGEELLVRIGERAPGSPLAERAMIELADFYYRISELESAVTAYDVFLANFPKSRYSEHARTARIAANVGRFRGPNYDASGLADARIRLQELAAVDPPAAQRANADAYIARIDESTAAQILEKARWYLRRSDPVSARLTLQRVIQRHPETVSARTALKMLEDRGWEIPAPATAPAASGGDSAAAAPVSDQPAAKAAAGTGK